MKIFKNKKGLTLIELIITIAIFTILTSIMIFGFLNSREIKKVKIASVELLDDLRLAQNQTMAGKTTSGVFPIGGYGLHIDIKPVTGEPNQYIIFGDQESPINSICVSAPNERYDNDDEYVDACANDFVAKKVVLPDMVEIVRMRTKDGTSRDYIDITFMPPKPMIYAGWDETPAGRDPTSGSYNAVANENVEIVLKHIQKNVCRKVTVIAASSQMSEGFISCPP